MITYTDNLENIDPDMLKGFFVGWEKFPTPEKHLEFLRNSDYKIIAVDEERKRVIGFINAISDKVLSAYIPLLEVLPEYQHQGIASELVKKMFEKLKDFYMIDLVCDESLENFYSRFGMKKCSSMMIRNYSNQHGIKK